MPNYASLGIDSSDVLSVTLPGGAIAARFDSAGRRRVGTTTTPAVAAGAGTGTSPSASVVGTDEHGLVTLTTGSGTPSAGTVATVTFAQAFGATPKAVFVSPADSATAALNPYASATTTALTIGTQGAAAASTAYKFNYWVVGG